tara:strand:- start:239 stop:907 length:669 start_codon:yes stop_codon:yes gene_type:complete
MKLAISGASGKTGYRVCEEAKAKGINIRLLVRKSSEVPASLQSSEQYIIDLNNQQSLDAGLKDCDSLIIATGARPNIDLTGPARIDACGVRNQVNACIRNDVKRIILVSSLCTGKLFHPLNLFGLILIWKRLGERELENSQLDWTIIRPGGLNEEEDQLNRQSILYTSRNTQQEGSIPRRLVAKTCVEALNTKSSIRQIIEITSNETTKQISMEKALKTFKV